MHTLETSGTGAYDRGDGTCQGDTCVAGDLQLLQAIDLVTYHPKCLKHLLKQQSIGLQ